MKYTLYWAAKNDGVIENNTIQMYNGESLTEIVKILKGVIQNVVENKGKLLEPDLKTKSEIFSTKMDGQVNSYNISASKANKVNGWGALNPDEYTEFILDMKRWVKNKYTPEMGNLEKMCHFSDNTISHDTGNGKYTIA